MGRPKRDYSNGINGFSIDAKCPKCERIHKVVMLWIGRGMPRRYCEYCQSAVSVLDSGLDSDYNWNKHAMFGASRI